VTSPSAAGRIRSASGRCPLGAAPGVAKRSLIASPDDLADALAIAHQFEPPEARSFRHHPLENVDGGNLDAVDLDDEVAGQEAVAARQRSTRHFGDDDAAKRWWKAKLFGDARRDVGHDSSGKGCVSLQ